MLCEKAFAHIISSEVYFMPHCKPGSTAYCSFLFFIVKMQKDESGTVWVVELTCGVNNG